ncbi:MAG: TetR family transcriptional regulator [Phycisphaeraceae bacterium]
MKSILQTAVPDSALTTTEQQLIDAAGETFARLGFHATTIRHICQLAHANIAAVNYHFGGKSGCMPPRRGMPTTAPRLNIPSGLMIRDTP